MQNTEAGTTESAVDCQSDGVTEQQDWPVSGAPGRLARDEGSLAVNMNGKPKRETRTRMR